jgi:nicotinic acid mononucleotide adenylyltransferase
MVLEGKQSRIGIYAGTFDPVHAGHVSFALHAMTVAQLDEVYFLPERLPRYKPGAAHFAHRVAMLKRAVKPHPDLQIIELVLHTSQSLRLPASAVTVVDSMQPNVSSTQMRLALALNHSVKGLLPSVRKYANKEWLYVHIPRSKNVDA